MTQCHVSATKGRSSVASMVMRQETERLSRTLVRNCSVARGTLGAVRTTQSTDVMSSCSCQSLGSGIDGNCFVTSLSCNQAWSLGA